MLQEAVSKELKHVEICLDAKLAVNVNKTKYFAVCSPQNILNKIVNKSLDKERVKQVEHVKFLGFLLDENLKWQYHLSQLSKS